MAKRPKSFTCRRLLTYKRLDISALEAASELYRILAAKQPPGDVKDALSLAGRITNTMLIGVSAAEDLRLFLESTTGRWR